MNFIVFDLETTCWDGNPPTDIREVIEIGAFRVDRFGEVNDQFQSFIRPTYYPRLSPYCTNLTNIQQAQVDTAKKFPIVMERFIDFIDTSNDFLLCAWGKMDKIILEAECEDHDIHFDGLEHYIDLKKQYHSINRSKRAYGLFNSLRREGIEFEGEQHRAEYDAYNLTKLFVRYIDQWIY